MAGKRRTAGQATDDFAEIDLKKSKQVARGGSKLKRPRRDYAAEMVQPASPVELDRFQKEAIEALMAGYSVLVAAPTGTGKTLIAEKILEEIMARGQGAVYTSPIKALSNQKYRDFCRLFGDERVGLITGDVSINEYGQLLVMTTEIFRNWCFSQPQALAQTSHVIFDEIHYLDDAERGTAWEESIIFAPPHIKILGLSATVPNVREIADWIAEVRGQPVMVVEERKRAVPLVIQYISPAGEILTPGRARAVIEELVELKAARVRHLRPKRERWDVDVEDYADYWDEMDNENNGDEVEEEGDWLEDRGIEARE